MENLLSIRDLKVNIPLATGDLKAVRGVNFDIKKGETLCIVGESGCGKSLTSLAIIDLLPKRAIRQAEYINFADTDLLSMTRKQMRNVRGNRISMIFQDPMTSLNPSYTIGNQLMEALIIHQKIDKKDAETQVIEMLGKVGITAAKSRLGQYPHQLSGGLRQRVMISMALLTKPDLLIADEPTTALDVTIQAQVLRLLRDLQKELNMGMILITHDLGVVARVADKVAIMYAGEIVESGTAEDIFNSPQHPYTKGLMGCIPIPGKTARGEHLGSIPGIVPSLIGNTQGCAFRERCDVALEGCQGDIPERVKEYSHLYRCLIDNASLSSNISSGVT